MSQQNSIMNEEACAIIGTCLSDVAAGRLPPPTLIPAISADSRAYMDDDYSVVWYPAKPLNLDTSIGLGTWSLTSAARVKPLQLPAVEDVFFCVFLPVAEGSPGGASSSGFLPGTWQLVMESEGHLSRGSAALEVGPPSFLQQLQTKLQTLAVHGNCALLGLHVSEGSNYVDLYLLPPTCLTAAGPSHHSSSRNSLEVSRPLQPPSAMQPLAQPQTQQEAAAEAVRAKPPGQAAPDATVGDVYQQLQRALEDNTALQQQLVQANVELELLRRQNQDMAKQLRTKVLRVTCLEQQVSAAEAKADAANTALQAEVAATATAAQAHKREVQHLQRQADGVGRQSTGGVPGMLLTRQSMDFSRTTYDAAPSSSVSPSPPPGAVAGSGAASLSPAAASRAAASMMEQWHGVEGSVRRSRDYSSAGVTPVTRGYHSMDVSRSPSMYTGSAVGAPGYSQAQGSFPRSLLDTPTGSAEDLQAAGGVGRAGYGGLSRAPAVSAAVVASSSLFGPSMPQMPSIPSSRARYASDGGLFGVPSPHGF